MRCSSPPIARNSVSPLVAAGAAADPALESSPAELATAGDRRLAVASRSRLTAGLGLTCTRKPQRHEAVLALSASRPYPRSRLCFSEDRRINLLKIFLNPVILVAAGQSE